MKADDKLDLITQNMILELGSVLCDSVSGRLLPGMNEIGIRPEQVDAMVERIVASLRERPAARRALGISQGLDAGRLRMRVAAVAYLAWQTLRLNIHKTCIGELAAAIADPRLSPAEGLIRGRHEVGRLIIQRNILIGGSEQCDRPVFTHAMLCGRILVFLSGGADSVGFLSYARAAGKTQTDEEREDGVSTPGTKPVPTARQLYEQVRKRVLNCDRQLMILCSRISLAACRADMLSKGVQDLGVGNQVIVVFGETGTGKTFAVEEIARASNLVFSSFDGSGLSGSGGWAGSHVEDAIRQALVLSGGDAKRASTAIICYDEIDKVLKGGLASHRLEVQGDLLRPLGGNTITIGGKRNFDGPSMPYSCVKNCFVLSGVFEGLDDLSRPRKRRGMGFQASVEGERDHADYRHGLCSYGVLPEVCARVSAFVRMPAITASAVVQALLSPQGIIEGYNHVLGERGIVLRPMEAGVRLLAEHVVEVHGGYRLAKHILGTLSAELLFNEARGTIVVDAPLVRRSIERATGRMDSDGGIEPSGHSCDAAVEADSDAIEGHEPLLQQDKSG